MPTPKVVARLWERWRIIATPIVHAEYEGARITPNVYTTLEEIDTFAGGDGRDLREERGDLGLRLSAQGSSKSFRSDPSTGVIKLLPRA